MNIEEEAYTVLRENLLQIKKEYKDREVVLCPICLSEISKDDILTGGVEHIIPRAATKKDSTTTKQLGTVNQRSGITILCRYEREI